MCESLPVQRRVCCARGELLAHLFGIRLPRLAGYLCNVDLIYYGINSIIIYKLRYFSIYQILKRSTTFDFKMLMHFSFVKHLINAQRAVYGKTFISTIKLTSFVIINKIKINFLPPSADSSSLIFSPSSLLASI